MRAANPSRHRTIQGRAPNENETRPQAQGDDDIGAAAYTTVHHEYNLVTNRGVNGRQDFERCGRLIELSAAVVGNDNAVDADFGSADRVVSMHQPLNYQMTRP